MWAKSKRPSTGTIDTLIGPDTRLEGDVVFSGGLHVDGTIHGNVTADGDNATLTLSEGGVIIGEVRVPSVVLNGRIEGDVHAGHVELATRSRIAGNLYYRVIEMAMGAEVNGSLVHRGERDEAREPARLTATRVLEAAEENS
ncbi:polymer-forming cytoskeletal protein [Ectothiorhodospiraceae bacterium 2226]|nr:polymer-forming cytoskeletal protein [Ectothiorhodospiraceae bacterium 2226]